MLALRFTAGPRMLSRRATRTRPGSPALLTALLVAAVAFASTNVDDIFVLLGFFADPAFRARHVVLGQFLGIGALVALSFAGALAALVIPPAYLGLLGLVPIALGLKKLWELRRGSSEEDEAELTAHPAAGAHRVLSVAGVTLANGGDNIGVYVPMLATRSAQERFVVVVVFAVMTGVWCLVAHALVRHRTLGAPLRRFGRIALPWVLVAVGLVILLEGGTVGLMLG